MDEAANKGYSRLLGVCAFLGVSRGLELVPAKGVVPSRQRVTQAVRYKNLETKKTLSFQQRFLFLFKAYATVILLSKYTS